jgi:poly-beta-1,6-N-acetyl-D-glucosamine N-deacetylase PgaB
MRKLLASTCLLLLGTIAPAQAADSFLTLCWHNVTETHTGNTFSVQVDQLAKQFQYLKDNGYHPVSLKEVMAARAGKRALPEKAILLTFDDGLASFSHFVYPLLKSFNYKAVFAVVGKWTDDGMAQNYEPTGKPQAAMTSWKDSREMINSGLVEVLPHTFDLHHGEVFNPQGNEAPSAAFFKYFPNSKTYETNAEFVSRIDADMVKTVEAFKSNLGYRPHALVWPYGVMNTLAEKSATKHGMPVQLTLEEGPTYLRDLPLINRTLVMGATTPTDFGKMLKRELHQELPIRSARVSLDSIYRADPGEGERELGNLLERLRAEAVTHVFLESYSRDADGKIRNVYYPNSYLPMRQDFFGRVSHQILTRARVIQVIAVFPTAGYLNAAGKEVAPSLLASAMARNSNIDGLMLEGHGSKAALGAISSALHKYRPLAHVWKSVEALTALAKKDSDWKITFGGLTGAVVPISASQKPTPNVSAWHPSLRQNIVIEVPIYFAPGCEKPRPLSEVEAQVDAWKHAGFKNLGFRAENGCENRPDPLELRDAFSSAPLPLHPVPKAPILERNNR